MSACIIKVTACLVHLVLPIIVPAYQDCQGKETVKRACPSGRVVKPPAAVHTGQGSLPVRVEALVHPLRESSLLKARVHAIGLFLDRHRGLTCVFFKM